MKTRRTQSTTAIAQAFIHQHLIGDHPGKGAAQRAVEGVIAAASPKSSAAQPVIPASAPY